MKRAAAIHFDWKSTVLCALLFTLPLVFSLSLFIFCVHFNHNGTRHYLMINSFFYIILMDSLASLAYS